MIPPKLLSCGIYLCRYTATVGNRKAVKLQSGELMAETIQSFLRKGLVLRLPVEKVSIFQMKPWRCLAKLNKI